MNNGFLSEVLGWLSFLQRYSVLQQLLLTLAWIVLVQQLRFWRPQRPVALSLLWRLTPAMTTGLGAGLIALMLMALGQRAGLLLLLFQITLSWILLRLVENQILARILAPASLQILITRLLRPLFLLGVLLVLLDALGSLSDLSNLSLGVWFDSEVSLGTLFQVLVVLYLLLVGLELPANWISTLLQKTLSISDGSGRALELILRYVVFFFGVVWALGRLGINQNGLLAVAGGLSVGLGFGIKEVVSNIISGLWLLIEGSVRPGEVLMHNGEVCQVRRLGPRATTLWRGSDNAELVVPNQNFFTTATTTYTRSDRMRRCSLTLSVGNGWDPEQVIGLLEQLAAEQPGVLASPPPSASLKEFGSEAYQYGLSFSIGDPLRAGSVTAALRLAIVRRFQQLNIPPPS
ncbi:MAG: mechanosensitive ion channel domain-containing protein [Synechococcaceae cyanobacterium]|nr:mechanosensitive ion channel domain-containing protein [Synechococcaceae cyanobacterium]